MTRLRTLLLLVLMLPSLLLTQGVSIGLCRCGSLAAALASIAEGCGCCASDDVRGAGDLPEGPIAAPIGCDGCDVVTLDEVDLTFEASAPLSVPGPSPAAVALPWEDDLDCVLPRVLAAAHGRAPPAFAGPPPGLLPGTRPLRI